MNEQQEVWKPIPGYEGVYEVSDQGRVRSLDRVVIMKNGVYRPTKGRVLIPKKHPGGYCQVCLVNGVLVREYRFIHRLVLLVFLGEPLPKMEVNHINGDKKDNRLLNLEYVTSSENNYHAYRIGLMKPVSNKGEKAGCVRLTEGEVRQILEMKRQGIKQIDIARLFGMSKGAIAHIIHGRSWTHIER